MQRKARAARQIRENYTSYYDISIGTFLRMKKNLRPLLNIKNMAVIKFLVIVLNQDSSFQAVARVAFLLTLRKLEECKGVCLMRTSDLTPATLRMPGGRQGSA